MATRTQVAAALAERLEHHDRHKSIREAAAWLVATGRARQARYLARDVAAQLEAKGYVLVRVTTARSLEHHTRERLEHFIQRQTGAKELEMDMIVDPNVVGGVQIETPLAALDATVRTKLARYVEGVMNE
jgi:F0F1-type ATP synthase delta subunit